MAFRSLPIPRIPIQRILPFNSQTRSLASLSCPSMAPSTIDRVGVCIDAHQSKEQPMKHNHLTSPHTNGDLNNISSMRAVEKPTRNPAFAFRSLAIQEHEDDADIRAKYRPFLLSDEIQRTDWVSRLELATVTELAYNNLKHTGSRLKILILYGSLRKRSASSPQPSNPFPHLPIPQPKSQT